MLSFYDSSSLIMQLKRLPYWLMLLSATILIVICFWLGNNLLHQYQQKIDIFKKDTNFTIRQNQKASLPKYFSALFRHTVIISPTVINKKNTSSSTKAIFPTARLLGIIFNTDTLHSLAIIHFDNKQILLGVGEAIGNTKATVTKITNNEVTLKLSGKSKILKIRPRFPKHLFTQETTQIKKGTLVNKKPLERFKAELSASPNNLKNYVLFNPVFDNSNNIFAYRITAGSDKKIFTALGLKQNDLVTAISSAKFNIPLSNSDALSSLWDQMKAIDSFILHIERDNQKREIIIDLK